MVDRYLGSKDMEAVKSIYNLAVSEMVSILDERSGFYKRILVPGDTATLLWRDMCKTGKVGVLTRLKTKVLDHKGSHNLYDPEVSKHVRWENCKRITRSSPLLVIDDWALRTSKIQYLTKSFAHFGIDVHFLLLTSARNTQCENITVVSNDQELLMWLQLKRPTGLYLSV